MKEAKGKTPARARLPGHGTQFIANESHREYIALRRLAPYARHVLQLRRSGIEPNVFCFAGSDAWNQAEHRRRQHGDGTALVLPPEDAPEAYLWPALDALVAVPGDCDGERFRRLVVALLSAGCRCVVEVRPDQRPACHYADERDVLEVAA